MLSPSTGTRTRTTLCRRTNHSTRCAYLCRESSSGPSVGNARGCGCCDGFGRGKPGRWAIADALLRAGTGSFATTFPTPSPTASTTLLATTSFVCSLRRGSVVSLPPYLLRRDVRLLDTVGCAWVARKRDTSLRSKWMDQDLGPARWMSDWMLVDRGQVGVPWAGATLPDEARL